MDKNWRDSACHPRRIILLKVGIGSSRLFLARLRLVGGPTLSSYPISFQPRYRHVHRPRYTCCPSASSLVAFARVLLGIFRRRRRSRGGDLGDHRSATSSGGGTEYPCH